jgi:catechol 2,3-dioxygenase-like lactoylglutathione lyase family enzyme
MVSRVGHVALRVTDVARSISFAEEILGLRVTERVDDTTYLTCNERHHELMLIESELPGCDHLAFETFDPAAIPALREELARRDVPILDDPLEAGIEAAVRFIAPGGFVIEVFHGMATDEPADYDTCGVRPRKFEHISVNSTVKPELEVFMQELLGLRVSDRAEDRGIWMRVSDEHHGFSILADQTDALQHYAWQIECWDDMRRVGDRLMATGRRFLWGPGHHGIGDNYFSYFFDADGAIVEYSGDIQRIEDEATYVPRTWPDVVDTVNRWGNPPPPAEFVASMFPIASRNGVGAR